MLRALLVLAIVVGSLPPNASAIPVRAACDIGGGGVVCATTRDVSDCPSCPPPTGGEGNCELLCVEDPLFIASSFVSDMANITNALLDQWLRIAAISSGGRLRCDGEVEADIEPFAADADAGCDRIVLVPATDIHGAGPLNCRVLATGDVWVNTSTWSSSDPRTWADDLNPATPIWVDPCVLQ